MSKMYKGLPWPYNLWSAVFQRQISEDELPDDWELVVEHIVGGAEGEDKRGIIESYFRNGITLSTIGAKYGITAEAVRQRIAKYIENMQCSAKCVYFINGFAEGERLLSEKITDNEPVEVLNLSTRTYNCLKRGRIDTVGQLKEKNEQDLLNIRNFGMHCLIEIQDSLKKIEEFNYKEYIATTGAVCPKLNMITNNACESVGMVPVIHARWLECPGGYTYYICSACGGPSWYFDVCGGVAKSPFCPNCGAKMGGELNAADGGESEVSD